MTIDGKTEEPTPEALMIEVERKILHNNVESDFLTNIFVIAASSLRKETTCAPYPFSVMQNSRVLVEKNFEELSMLMSLIPRIDQISKKNESLSLVSIKVLKLLWWILCSKKSVTLLKDEKQKFEEFLPHDVFVRSDKIRELLHHRLHGHVPHYVFKVEGNRANDDKFSREKQKNGSFLAFHGTSAENMHSIFRCGLLNVSGTPLEQNGAIYGSGIYFSADVRVAMNFSKSAQLWDKSSFGKRAKFLLVCEIVKGSETLFSPQDDLKKGISYIVVQNNEMVKLKYIWMFCEGRKTPELAISKQLSSKAMIFIQIHIFQVVIVVYIAIILGIYLSKSNKLSLTLLLPKLGQMQNSLPQVH